MDLPRAVCLLTVRHGRILAVPRRDGRGYGLPGGKVEPDETDAQAVLRETFEETGYYTMDLTPFYEVDWPPGPEPDGQAFHVTYFTGQVSPTGQDGEFTPEWVTPEVLLAGPFGANLAVVLKLVSLEP